MKVTVCQIDPSQKELNTNLENLTEHVRKHQSDFILLPEMGFSEWLAADPNPSAERWSDSVRVHDHHISELGRLGVDNVMGTRPIVNESGSRRNLAYVWTRKSNTAEGFHEKYYLPDEDGYWEHTWYDRGLKSFDVARIGDAVAGVQICTEMWFFDCARHYAKSRVDMLCVPRATPHGSIDKWLAGGQVAAVCSGSYCLSSNLWCPKGGNFDLGGLAWVIDPEGNVLAQTNEHEPFATVEIDLGFSRRSKSTYPRYVPE